MQPTEKENSKRGRGRPPNPNKKGRKPYVPTGNKRGRPPKREEDKVIPQKRVYKRIPEELKKRPGRKKVCLPFYEAREIILDENIGSKRQYRRWYKFNRPTKIPRNPDLIYKDDWVDWNYFLGNDNLPFSDTNNCYKFLNYEDAHLKIRKFGLKKYEEWKELIKAGKLPSDIPKRPDLHYRKDWISWKQFLGYNHLERIMDSMSEKVYLFIAKYYNTPQNIFKISLTKVKLDKLGEYARLNQFKVVKVYDYEEGVDFKMVISRHGQPYWGGEQGDYEIYNVYNLISDFDTRLYQASP